MQYPKGFIAVPVLIIAVIIAGLAAGGSWWYVKQQDEKAGNTNTAVVVNANANTAVATNSNVNAQVNPVVDAYGCAIAAGYQWCESKQKCIRAWEEVCPGTVVETLSDVGKQLPVQTSLSTYDYLGDLSLVDLVAKHRDVTISNIEAVSFIGDRALIGGNHPNLLYFYDGDKLTDITSLVTADPKYTYSRVEAIGNNGTYWLFSVYGSNYLKFYKYNGSTVQEIVLPTLPRVQSSWAPEAITWTGEYFLMFLADSLYKFDGSTFTEIQEFSTNFNPDVAIVWNGQSAMVVVPEENGPSKVYSYSNGKVVEVRAFDEHLNSAAYNGEYWLFGGWKRKGDSNQATLYKYQAGTWTDLSTKLIGATKGKDMPIISIGWSGSYWVVNGMDAVYVMHGDAASYAKEFHSYYYHAVAFGQTYGLIGSGAGGGTGGLVKIITKDRTSIKTVQSSRLLECFSPTSLQKNPEIVSLLASKQFTAKNFTDLCIATSSNPQKRFFVISPTPTEYDTQKKENVTCDNCFKLEAFSLEDGSMLLRDGTGKATEDIIASKATTCEFGAREGDVLLVQCEMQQENPSQTYYNLLQSNFSSSSPFAYFGQQCSVWTTDATQPLQKGEYEKELYFYSKKVKARCGSGPIPNAASWATYSQDGFTFKYPKTYYFREYIENGIHHFVVHERNLGGGEGGGPVNDKYIRLKPATTYSALLAEVKASHNFTGEYSDKMQESTQGSVKKIVVTSGPGMCDGETVYMLSAKYILEYGQYCGSWEGIDKTFVLN